jgi:oligopeptide/dipeptide ABC transporter ATP-binding protein
MSDAAEIVLAVEDLVTGFDTEEGQIRALSVIRLLPYPAASILSGHIHFEGRDLAGESLEGMQRIRGARIGMIFQEPMTALNPVHRIGRQITETLKMHRDLSDSEALALAVSMLEKVGIPSPEIRVGEYPHQLSGGMRQRVMIAMALICDPALVIADEPTTALDVTIQAQILDLLQTMQDESGTSVIMITHDLGVIAETCDDVVVMYAGRVAELGTVEAVFGQPQHPYTRGLLASIPRLATPRKTRLTTIDGMVPALTDMPDGCRFNNRCPHAVAQCASVYPTPQEAGGGRLVACHRWRELAAQA